MKKYSGVAVSLTALLLLVYHTIYGNEQIGNLVWFWMLLISLISMIVLVVVPNKTWAKHRKERLRFIWVIHALMILLSAANGWFVVATMYGIGWGFLRLKTEVGKGELEKAPQAL